MTSLRIAQILRPEKSRLGFIILALRKERGTIDE
jgi:hypothetical protein